MGGSTPDFATELRPARQLAQILTNSTPKLQQGRVQLRDGDAPVSHAKSF